MNFFKRRSRANSYIDDAPQRSKSYDDYDDRPSSSRNAPPVTSPTTDEKDMYPRQAAPQEAYAPGLQNGGHNAMPTMANSTPTLSNGKSEPMPDLLAQAFNQAVRPYTEKIEQLQNQLADLQAWVEQLEQQRAEVHGWIDKRGLRPGTYVLTIVQSSNIDNKQTSHPQSLRSWIPLHKTRPSHSTPNWTARSQ
jgi:hypothetical protein